MTSSACTALTPTAAISERAVRRRSCNCHCGIGQADSNFFFCRVILLLGDPLGSANTNGLGLIRRCSSMMSRATGGRRRASPVPLLPLLGRDVPHAVLH